VIAPKEAVAVLDACRRAGIMLAAAESCTGGGAVSREVALAMTEGALAYSRAGVSVAVTGIAGPGGGTAEKPVGLVHIAARRKGLPPLHRECRFGDIGRAEVRQATVLAALELIIQALR